MSNKVTTITASKMMTSPAYQNRMMEVIKDPKKVSALTTSICSALANNPALNECEPASIMACALLGQGLNLTPSPQLGRYYMVPFKDKKSGTSKATFILGLTF